MAQRLRRLSELPPFEMLVLMGGLHRRGPNYRADPAIFENDEEIHYTV